MTDHQTCKRAVWRATGSESEGEWRCYACGEWLANQDFANGIVLRPDMVSLGERDGIKAFGLPRRVMRGKGTGRASAPASRRFPWAPKDGAFVYCPRQGVCGRGQHLHSPQIEEIKRVLYFDGK